jgi:hypothetical protein
MTSMRWYAAFVVELRDSLDAMGGGYKWISAYVNSGGSAPIAFWSRDSVQSAVDFVNMSGYDIYGCWGGFCTPEFTTERSPLYSSIRDYPEYSLNAGVVEWKASVFPESKMLLMGTSNGAEYYGGTNLRLYIGGGATGGAALPGQIWDVAPGCNSNDLKFRDNGEEWVGIGVSWDTISEVSYYSVDLTGSANDRFIGSDDGRTFARKWRYAVDSTIGGLCIWDVNGTRFNWLGSSSEDGSITARERWPFLWEWSDSLNETIDYTPTITPSTSSLAAFTSTVPNPSTSKSWTVSGAHLGGDVTITAPTDFQVSTDNANWYSSRALTPTDSNLTNVTMYARMNRATAGSPSGNITHAASGATTKNVAVSGTASSVPDATNVIFIIR